LIVGFWISGGDTRMGLKTALPEFGIMANLARGPHSGKTTSQDLAAFM
jgi:hypothetical protein